MTEFKISNFIVGMIITVTILTGLGILLADLADKYGSPGEYDENELLPYDKLAEMNSLTQQLENKTKAVGPKTGFLDLLGFFTGSAIDTAKLSMKSVETFKEMSLASTEKAQINPMFYTALVGIVVFLFIVVIVTMMVKWNW